MGLVWDTDSDELKINVNDGKTLPIKRGVFQKTHVNFNPIGFSSPFILGGRLLFQRMCELSKSVGITLCLKDLPKNGLQSLHTKWSFMF